MDTRFKYLIKLLEFLSKTVFYFEGMIGNLHIKIRDKIDELTYREDE